MEKIDIKCVKCDCTNPPCAARAAFLKSALEVLMAIEEIAMVDTEAGEYLKDNIVLDNENNTLGYKGDKKFQTFVPK